MIFYRLGNGQHRLGEGQPNEKDLERFNSAFRLLSTTFIPDVILEMSLLAMMNESGHQASVEEKTKTPPFLHSSIDTS